MRILVDVCEMLALRSRYEHSTVIISITLSWNLLHSETAFMPFVLMVFARSRIIC